MTYYRANPLPIPTPTPITAPFWEATRIHRLMLQRCSSGHTFYYPRSHCPVCLSKDCEWVEASGRGRVYSYTVARRAQSPEFADDLPYVIGAVTLEEGPRMTTLLVEVDPDNVAIGEPVEVTWQDLEGGLSLPYFRPAP